MTSNSQPESLPLPLRTCLRKIYQTFSSDGGALTYLARESDRSTPCDEESQNRYTIIGAL